MCLFADAEAGKDPPQQVIRAECAGNLTEELLSMAQILRQQLAGTRQGQLCMTVLQGRTGMPQGFQMAATGAEAALGGLFITHAGLEVFAQQLQPLATDLGAQADGDMAILADL